MARTTPCRCDRVARTSPGRLAAYPPSSIQTSGRRRSPQSDGAVTPMRNQHGHASTRPATERATEAPAQAVAPPAASMRRSRSLRRPRDGRGATRAAGGPSLTVGRAMSQPSTWRIGPVSLPIEHSAAHCRSSEDSASKFHPQGRALSVGSSPDRGKSKLPHIPGNASAPRDGPLIPPPTWNHRRGRRVGLPKNVSPAGVLHRAKLGSW